MNITLKGVKIVHSQSRETNCFSATVYVDDTALCGASNDGHGGSNMYYSTKNGPTDWRQQLKAIEAELATEMVSDDIQMPNDIEFVISKLLDQSIAEKDIKSLIRRRIVYCKNGKIYQLPAKFKPSASAYDNVKKSSWWKPEYKILAEMPMNEAVELYLN